MKTSERILYLFLICVSVAIGNMIVSAMITPTPVPTDKVIAIAIGSFLGALFRFSIFSGIAWLVSRLFGGSLRSIATIAAVFGGGFSCLFTFGEINNAINKAKVTYIFYIYDTDVTIPELMKIFMESPAAQLGFAVFWGFLMGTAAYFFAKVLFAKSEKKIKAEEEAQRILKALSKSELEEHAARILKERERKREEEARRKAEEALQKAEEARQKAEEERLKREEEEKARKEQRLKDLESLSDEELQKLISSKQEDANTSTPS